MSDAFETFRLGEARRTSRVATPFHFLPHSSANKKNLPPSLLPLSSKVSKNDPVHEPDWQVVQGWHGVGREKDRVGEERVGRLGLGAVFGCGSWRKWEEVRLGICSRRNGVSVDACDAGSGRRATEVVCAASDGCKK